MPDPQHNGRHERRDADTGAAERLGRDWDAIAVQRRSGGPAILTATVTDPTLIRLVELRAADTASEPRPGFLDHLERELMDASLPKTTVPVRPSVPTIAVVPGRRHRRHGRGVIDVMAVAAVVALLIAGSWSIWSQNTGGPGNGTGVPGFVAGLATPDATANADRNGLVALNQTWATNADSDVIDSVAPVSTSDCTTPPRQPGSLVAAVEQQSQTPTQTLARFAQLTQATPPDITTEPAASAEDVAAARVFFVQFAACRFAYDLGDNGQIEPFTGAFWNLYSTATLAHQALYQPYDGGPAPRTAEQQIDSAYRFEHRTVEASAWPFVVDDVREFPADPDGARRLRVRFHSVMMPSYQIDTILVRENGAWKIATVEIAVSGDQTSAYQVSNIDVGDSTVGPRGISSSATQIERDMPVLMSITNRGGTVQAVSIDGQDLGPLAPGQTINLLPFTIDSGASVGDAGHPSFTVTARPADGSGEAKSLAIGVYPAGALAAERTGATPAASVTPVASTAAAAREPAVSYATLNVPGIEQVSVPAQQTSDQISASECSTAPRAEGSVDAALATGLNSSDWTGGSSYLAPNDEVTQAQVDRLPDAAVGDQDAANGLLRQLVACRFAADGHSGSIGAQFAAPYWSLFSDEYFRINLPPLLQHPIPQADQYLASLLTHIVGGQPLEIANLKVLPPDAKGQPRLLFVLGGEVQAVNGGLPAGVMVWENGTWRIIQFPQVSRWVTSTMPLDIRVSGNRIQSVVGAVNIFTPHGDLYVPASIPVVMDIYNAGSQDAQVTIAGQGLGTLAPGAELRIDPWQFPAQPTGATSLTLGLTQPTINLVADYGQSATPENRLFPTFPVTPAPGTPSADLFATPSATPIALTDPGLESPRLYASDAFREVSASDCSTTARRTGSVDDALRTPPDSTDWTGGSSYFARNDIVTQQLIDSFPEASFQDASAARGLIQQVTACRFTAGTQSDGDGTASFDTPYWNLFSDDYFRFNKPTLDARATVTDPAVLPFTYLSSAAGPLAPEVTDVRQMPPDSRGQPRLLVELGGDIETESGGPAFAVMVQSYGAWQITQLSTLTSIASTAMPLDVFIEPDGSLGGGPFAYNYNAYGSPYIPAGLPVLLDLYNASDSPVQITISGQDLGMLAPGQEQMLAPFAFPDQPGETTSLTVGMSSPDFPNLHGISFIADYGQLATPENRRYDTFPPTPPADSTVPAIVHPSAYPNSGSTPEAVGTPALSGTPVGQSTSAAG